MLQASSGICNSVAIIGVGHTDYAGDNARGLAGERIHNSYGYAAIAFIAALADAEIDRSEIDGLIVGPTTAYERVGEILGIDPKWGGQADAGLAVTQACMAISCGFAEVIALVYGNNQRTAAVQYGGANAASGNNFLAYVYHAPWGFTSQGALYALSFRRFQQLYGLTEAELGHVAVAQRQAARLNPNAVMQKPLTIEDYLASRYICEPLRLPDYCLVNDGGVVLIIAEASRAKRLCKKPVFIRGIGRAELNSNATSLEPRLFDFYLPAQKAAGKRSYEMAGLGPEDMDCLQIYDSFSLHIPLALEGYGYCERGNAGRFMTEEGISLKGRLPVNTSGGHLSESYMQGWNHQVEAVRQLRGECGARQVEACRFVHYSGDVAGKAISIIYSREV
jgi:acetyl-CoA acetyltransferase